MAFVGGITGGGSLGNRWRPTAFRGQPGRVADQVDRLAVSDAVPATRTVLAQAGIAGMRERTLALRGRLHVEDFAGGMQIRATLPFDQEREPA